MVKVDIDNPVLEAYAWTIIPVFTYEGYTNSGVYQVPLFKGDVNENVLKSVVSNPNPWKRFLEFLTEPDDTGKPTIEYLKPSSVIVRIIDGQREVSKQS